MVAALVKQEQLVYPLTVLYLLRETVLDCEVYISTDSISIFQRSRLIIDEVKGMGSSFSVKN